MIPRKNHSAPPKFCSENINSEEVNSGLILLGGGYAHADCFETARKSTYGHGQKWALRKMVEKTLQIA